jgi:hypothetical protein
MYANEPAHRDPDTQRYQWERPGYTVPDVDQDDSNLLDDEIDWTDDCKALQRLKWPYDRDHYIKVALEEALGKPHTWEVCALYRRLGYYQRCLDIADWKHLIDEL